MKKKLTLTLLTAALALACLTGCKAGKAPAQGTKVETGVETKREAEEEPELPDDVPSQETKDAIPEGTAIMAPPVDADGELPEGFDADKYYSGYTEGEPETPTGKASTKSAN